MLAAFFPRLRGALQRVCAATWPYAARLCSGLLLLQRLSLMASLARHAARRRRCWRTTLPHRHLPRGRLTQAFSGASILATVYHRCAIMSPSRHASCQPCAGCALRRFSGASKPTVGSFPDSNLALFSLRPSKVGRSRFGPFNVDLDWRCDVTGSFCVSATWFAVRGCARYHTPATVAAYVTLHD